MIAAEHEAPPLRNERGEFLQGVSGNPSGRPRGSRNKLGEAFLEALCADFLEHGAEAIAEMRLTDPTGYCRLIAALIPKNAAFDTPARIMVGWIGSGDDDEVKIDTGVPRAD